MMLAIKTDTKNMADNYLREMADIENSIFVRLFEIFAEYQKQRLILYGESSKDLQKSIRELDFMKTKKNPSLDSFNEIVEKPEEFISTKTVLIKTEELDYTKSKDFYKNKCDISDSESSCYVSWSKYFSKTPECISLSPGDLIEPLSENLNGWQYGVNITCQTKGWYPSSYIKSISSIQEFLLKNSTV